MNKKGRIGKQKTDKGGRGKKSRAFYIKTTVEIGWKSNLSYLLYCIYLYVCGFIYPFLIVKDE